MVKYNQNVIILCVCGCEAERESSALEMRRQSSALYLQAMIFAGRRTICTPSGIS